MQDNKTNIFFAISIVVVNLEVRKSINASGNKVYGGEGKAFDWFRNFSCLLLLVIKEVRSIFCFYKERLVIVVLQSRETTSRFRSENFYTNGKLVAFEMIHIKLKQSDIKSVKIERINNIL